MKILVFDTETTGLPTERNPSITETEKWPYIIQLSYIIYDFSMNDVISSYDEILKLPDGIEISPESINLHKITREKMESVGINRKIALEHFNRQLQKVDVVVGHNISFDKRMIMVECIRNNVQQRFNFRGVKIDEYCTMKTGVNLCKIEQTKLNGEKYFKYPTLSQLYFTLFNESCDKIHNAFVDVLMCLRCYAMTVYKIDLMAYDGTFRDMMLII